MKRITSLFLALVAVLLLCPAAQTASAAQDQEDYIAANHTKSNGRPYYIMVNRAQSTVTVYSLDENGYYTVPVKAMICSTGRKGHATPTGTFSIGGRWTWVHMLDNSYGQYCTQIKGNILFHSVCYTKKDPSTLMTEEYNGLGAPASLGCVRLQTVDAKWIFDNCAAGTKVTVYDGADPGPLGKPAKYIDCISEEQANGWDPTDPREENPWRTAMLYTDVLPGAWYYEDVRYVHQAGLMSGVSSSKFDPDAIVTYQAMAEILYQMAGGVSPDEAMNWAAERRLMDGMTGSGFAADGPVSRQGLVTMLYRYETICRERKVGNLANISTFKDAPAVRDYARYPMQWAIGNGLIQGTPDNTLDPTGQASRAQVAAILHRYGELTK